MFVFVSMACLWTALVDVAKDGADFELLEKDLEVPRAGRAGWASLVVLVVGTILLLRAQVIAELERKTGESTEEKPSGFDMKQSLLCE
jgi:hypothetical protein